MSLTRGPDWFDQVRGQGVRSVATRLGLELVTVGTDTSFACPACGKQLRHGKGTDKRRAAKVTPDGCGWWCEPCEAKGDAVALAAARLTGQVKPPKEQWAQVRRECAAVGLCEADPRDPQSPTGVRYVPPAPSVEAPKALERLPADQVAALWASCARLHAVPAWELPEAPSRKTGDEGPHGWCGEVRRYLAGRGYNVGALAAADAARVVPPADQVASWPEWWPSSWAAAWRLMVPMFDGGGALVAMQARRVDGGGDLKTRNPRGPGVTAGTFFASAEGLELLRGTFKGPGLAVVEGLTDYLAAVSLVANLEPVRRPAVLGYVAGSGRGLTPGRVTLKRVNVLTDNDATGQRYADEVTEALARTTTRVRLEPIGGKRADLSDLLKHAPAKALAALTYGMGAEV